ncbi:hypothetical protein LDENG_00168170 [Lucifuga dentata]|nr:hypothetical protein LDENG_00168170 [Lucifuga dentata]
MEREELLRVEWRKTESEMEAGGKDHLCGDWSPGRTAQCWLTFNPPLLPPQRRRGSRRDSDYPRTTDNRAWRTRLLVLAYALLDRGKGSLQRPGFTFKLRFLCLQCAIGPCHGRFPCRAELKHGGPGAVCRASEAMLRLACYLVSFKA